MKSINLDENSPIPLYYQLENLIKEEIEEGNYKEGEKIPSERKLSELSNLSRMTVRKAVENLVKEGILERKRGQGTFVSANNLENSAGLIGFTESVKSHGMIPNNTVIRQQLIEPNAEISQRLNLGQGEKVILALRLRLADNEIWGLEESYIPYAICPKLLDIDISQRSIYRTLKEEGHKPTKATNEIEAISADEYLSSLLEVKQGKPILKNYRTTFSYERPINFSYNYYRGDKYTITTNSYK